jgi:hypothetical protein
MLFRIIVIAVLSMAIAILPIAILFGIKEKDGGMVVFAFFAGLAGTFFPSLLAALIYYFLVRKIDKASATRSQKIKVTLAFILICTAVLILWGYGEWLLSGDKTWSEFLERYSQFAGGNILVVPASIVMTVLYFSRFFPFPKPDQEHQAVNP